MYQDCSWVSVMVTGAESVLLGIVYQLVLGWVVCYQYVHNSAGGLPSLEKQSC